MNVDEYRKLAAPKVRPRGRMKPCGMNRLEQQYADLLAARLLAKEILWYSWDSVNLRIGERCFYKPDFVVMCADGSLEIHETKGFMEDDALVKIRVVAAQFPFPVMLVRLVKKQWEIKEL